VTYRERNSSDLSDTRAVPENSHCRGALTAKTIRDARRREIRRGGGKSERFVSASGFESRKHVKGRVSRIREVCEADRRAVVFRAFSSFLGYVRDR